VGTALGGAVGSGVGILRQYATDRISDEALDLVAGKLHADYPSLSQRQAQILAMGSFMAASGARATKDYMAKNLHHFRPASGHNASGKYGELETKPGTHIHGFKPDDTKPDILYNEVFKGEILRDKDGRVRGLEHTQRHHVIHQTLKDNPLWELAGVNPDNPENIMLLPTKKGKELYNTDRSVHQGRHVDTTRDELREKMDKVLREGLLNNYTQEQYKEKLLSIIKEEKAELRSGEKSLYKIKQ